MSQKNEEKGCFSNFLGCCGLIIILGILIGGCNAIFGDDDSEETKIEQKNEKAKETKENEIDPKQAFIDSVNANPSKDGADFEQDIKLIIENNMNESLNSKYNLVSEYAYSYKLSKKQLSTFTMDIVNAYKSGTYLSDVSNEQYMLENIFKATLVNRYYGNVKANESTPYGEFAFDFMQNTRDIYRGIQSVGDEVTAANERQMDKSIAQFKNQ